jgi:hypothetical protein
MFTRRRSPPRHPGDLLNRTEEGIGQVGQQFLLASTRYVPGEISTPRMNVPSPNSRRLDVTGVFTSSDHSPQPWVLNPSSDFSIVRTMGPPIALPLAMMALKLPLKFLRRSQ